MKLRSVLILTVLVISACSTRVEFAPASTASLERNAINVNTATVAELESLPYVGKKTADAIVEFRERNGPFRRVEQVMLIRGLSERRFAEMRPFIRAE
ncbi:MAG TPA: helix-hairpin-helix domain-containing protein [Pyrinomonadaceae bacterium]|jgi:competence protein ComEA|nr:helix-hairpin-helix domain-containing protein [Pyrinomonadaceae bacterium]